MGKANVEKKKQAAIAITVFMKMMGGSGVGIDNNPEAVMLRIPRRK